MDLWPTAKAEARLGTQERRLKTYKAYGAGERLLPSKINVLSGFWLL